MRLLLTLALLAVAARAARAGDFDFEDDELPVAPQEPTPPMPRSIDPPPEPVTRPWRQQASMTTARADVFVQLSPLGYTSSADRRELDVFARIGPGVLRTGARTVLAAFASYEISRMSYATFGAHALVMTRGWGGGLGALVAPSGHLGGCIAGCWRVACLELQLRDHPERGRTFASWLHLTFPIREVAGHRRRFE